MSEITFSSNRPTMPQLRAPSTMIRRAIGSNRLSISISCLLQGDNADSYESNNTHHLQGLRGQRAVSVGPLLRGPRGGAGIGPVCPAGVWQRVVAPKSATGPA